MPGSSQKSPHPTRLLIAANEPEMFRDFLNPFGSHFRQKGWRVDAAARDIAGSPECDGVFDNAWNVKWSRNPFGAENLIEAPRAFRRGIENAGYDLVHVHTPVPAFISRCAIARIARSRRPKLVYTVHGFHFHPHGSRWKNRAFLSLEKLAGRWTDCLVVINREDEEAARRYRLVPDNKIAYMPGIGIKRRDYEPKAVPEASVARFRQELRIGTTDPVILMLAEFNPGKRHHDAVRAFAATQRQNAHLVLAGEGSLRDEIALLAHKLGVSDRVHLVGFRRDVPVLLKSSAICILPSEREGLPKSIMEALNMGLPVIGTDIRGIHDLLADGAGFLVPLGNTEQLARTMDWILDHPQEAKAIGETGRSRMGIYERDHIIRLHEALYSKLLNGEPLN